LRAKAYFYDNETVDKMRHIVAERLDALEAGRGAATIILDLIAKWMKYDEKIDTEFNASPVEHGLSLKAQELRSKVFFGMKRTTLNAIMELVEKYLQCHGISTDGINDLGQLVLAVSQTVAKTALAGAATGAALNTAGQPGLRRWRCWPERSWTSAALR
jgi:hypothetical protein